MLKQLLKLSGLNRKQEEKVVKKIHKHVIHKGRVVAKTLVGGDADCMYGSSAEEPGRCPVCHNALRKIPNSNYRMRGKKGDFFDTYDFFCIVSEKFKKFCEENEYDGLVFVALPKSPGYYYFEVKNTFKLDITDTKFINKRECCGSYDSIIGPSRYKDKEQSIPTDDFICRTEQCYGSYNRKAPDIIVGLKTAEKMRQYGLLGIYFKNIHERP